MITIPEFVFDHQKDNFLEAIGMTNEDQHYLTCAVLYHYVMPIITTPEEEFEDFVEQESKSAIFERVYRKVEKNPAQVAMLLYVFHMTYEQITKDVTLAITMMENRIPRNKSLQETIGVISDVMRIAPLMHTISMMKRTRLSFEEFMAYSASKQSIIELDNPENLDKDYSDVDQLLRNILEKDE